MAGDDAHALIMRHSDAIDWTTFEQILTMDDDEDDREFSKGIVYDFFSQAKSTFEKMDASLEEGELKSLSDLGHFLKGSSATLGLTKVKDSCEKIQHLGAGKDATGMHDLDEQSIKKQLATIIKTAKEDFSQVESILKKFYRDQK